MYWSCQNGTVSIAQKWISTSPSYRRIKSSSDPKNPESSSRSSILIIYVFGIFFVVKVISTARQKSFKKIKFFSFKICFFFNYFYKIVKVSFLTNRSRKKNLNFYSAKLVVMLLNWKRVVAHQLHPTSFSTNIYLHTMNYSCSYSSCVVNVHKLRNKLLIQNENKNKKIKWNRRRPFYK